jgi:hypothetical protein
MLVAALATMSCAPKSVLTGPDLPIAATTGPVVYRDLADIPARPEVVSPENREEAIKALSEDRAATAQAASRLRTAPFDQPDPAPPSFQGFDSP